MMISMLKGAACFGMHIDDAGTKREWLECWCSR